MQEFYLGGRGRAQKSVRVHKSWARNAKYTAGVQCPLKKALEALGVFMLSRAIWALFFKHSDTKWDTKTIVD